MLFKTAKVADGTEMQGTSRRCRGLPGGRDRRRGSSAVRGPALGPSPGPGPGEPARAVPEAGADGPCPSGVASGARPWPVTARVSAVEGSWGSPECGSLYCKSE